MSLVRPQTGKLYTKKVNTWKWEGHVRFNTSKDGDIKYREVWLFLRCKKGVMAPRVQRCPSRSVWQKIIPQLPKRSVVTLATRKYGQFVCLHSFLYVSFNPLNAELNPICHLLAFLGAHHFLHVSRIRVKSLSFRLLMSYIYGAPILDVSRSHTTTQHSR